MAPWDVASDVRPARPCLDELGVEHLLPAVQALHVRSLLKVLGWRGKIIRGREEEGGSQGQDAVDDGAIRVLGGRALPRGGEARHAGARRVSSVGREGGTQIETWR